MSDEMQLKKKEPTLREIAKRLVEFNSGIHERIRNAERNIDESDHILSKKLGIPFDTSQPIPISEKGVSASGREPKAIADDPSSVNDYLEICYNQIADIRDAINDLESMIARHMYNLDGRL